MDTDETRIKTHKNNLIGIDSIGARTMIDSRVTDGPANAELISVLETAFSNSVFSVSEVNLNR